jgi:hypothetical protein
MMSEAGITRCIWSILFSFLLLAVAGFVPVAGQQVTAVARGDPYELSGTATGDPAAGVAVWVFGENYWRREAVPVTDDTFTFEIGGGETADLAPGIYTVIAQHPMGNGRFDVVLAPETPGFGQTSVVSTGGGRFVIEGPGALPSSQAAGALVTLLASPAIDDTYISTAFVLENPLMLPADPEAGVVRPGYEATIAGTTNLGAGNELVYSVERVHLEPDEETVAPPVAAGSVVVQPGNPNTWSLSFATAGWTPGYYLVTIENPATGYVLQTGVLLADNGGEEQAAIAVEETAMAAETGVSPGPAQAGGGALAVAALALLIGARPGRR